MCDKYRAIIMYDLFSGMFGYEERHIGPGQSIDAQRGLVLEFELPACGYDRDAVVTWFANNYRARLDPLREYGRTYFDGQGHIWQHITDQDRHDACDEECRIQIEVMDRANEIPGMNQERTG